MTIEEIKKLNKKAEDYERLKLFLDYCKRGVSTMAITVLNNEGSEFTIKNRLSKEVINKIIDLIKEEENKIEEEIKNISLNRKES